MGIGGVYPLSAAASYENDEGAKGQYAQRLRNVAWTQAWQQPGQMVPFVVALMLFGTFYTRYLASQYRIVMAVGAALTYIPLKQLLKKEPKPGQAPKQDTMIDLLGKGSDDEDDDEAETPAISIFGLFESVNKLNQGWDLAACCLCWFCSDFYSYGTSIYGPEIMERAYDGNLDLVKDYRFNVLSVAATLPTTWVSILLVGRMGTKELQLLGFGLNTLCFLIVGMVWALDTSSSAAGGLSDVGKFTIVVFIRALSRFGATTSTFVLPSELFGAEVRASSNGFAAAFGKTGAFGATMVTPFVYESKGGVPAIFFLYSGVAAVGFLLTQWLVPTIDREAKERQVETETRVQEIRRGAERIPLVGGPLRSVQNQVVHGE